MTDIETKVHPRLNTLDRYVQAVHLVTHATTRPRVLHQYDGSRVQVVFQNEVDAWFVKKTGQASASFSDKTEAVGHVQNLLDVEAGPVQAHRDAYTLLSDPDWTSVVLNTKGDRGSMVLVVKSAVPDLVRDLLATLPPAEREDFIFSLYHGTP